MMSHENPFVFGTPVQEAAFIDREAECSRLCAYLRNSQNVIIYSPRKFGKTSLVLKALSALEGQVLPVFIDCYAITSEKELAASLSEKVLSYYPEHEILSAVKRLFGGISPKITIKSLPEVEIAVEWQGESDWKESLVLPQKLAMDKGMPVALVFDEFQELASFENLLKVLRSSFQHQPDVSFVFIGSRRHMMEWIFQAQESPFYNFGAHINLRTIPEEAFSAYIEKAFAEGGIRLEEGVTQEILSLTGCHPHYTQRLCFELWYRGSLDGVVRPGEPATVLSEIMADLEDSYISIWEHLSSNQRRLLLAIVSGRSDLFSGDFVRDYDFRSPASVQSALRKLLGREIVSREGENYEVADVFLRSWLVSRFF